MKLTGGCLCKKVRYSVQTDVSKPASNYCHCRMCQLATGAPVAVFFTVPEEDVKFESDVGVYKSSEIAVRKFCTSCGTPIAFQFVDEAAKAKQVKELDICLTTLDTPDAVTPQVHIWTESQRPWFKVADDLPKFPQEWS